jgi:integrase
LALVDYLYSRPAYAGPELWLSSDNRGGAKGPLNYWTIRQILRRRCERAGVRNLNAHSFRHAFATELLNAGADLSAVSAIMGHSSTKVTEAIYAKWLPAGIQREYNEAWKRIKGDQ